MVDPKDLRIGNKVRQSNFPFVMTIDAISNKGHEVITQEKGLVPCSSLEPVLLTIDILRRMGFLMNVSEPYPHITIKKDWELLMDINAGKATMKYALAPITWQAELLYVHQLQNLYAILTGNELVFDL